MPGGRLGFLDHHQYSEVVKLQIFFMFTPNLGEMIQFDEHIFQMGWNHQLVSTRVSGWVRDGFTTVIVSWFILPIYGT